MNAQIQEAISTIGRDSEQETTVAASARTQIKGFAKLIRQFSGNPAVLSLLADTLDARVEELAADIAINTPATKEAVEPVDPNHASTVVAPAPTEEEAK